MQGVRNGSLALLLGLALWGAGCEDEDDDDLGGELDGGADSSTPRVDGSLLDANLPDGSDGTDGAMPSAYSCSSAAPPSGDLCGGSHCMETLAQIRSGAQTGAACAGDLETSSFCQLEVVEKVTTCIGQHAFDSDPNAVFNCAAPMLPGFAPACLTCFTESAKCGAKNCLTMCAVNPKSYACDLCRVEKGCISSFYACAGLKNPVPATR